MKSSGSEKRRDGSTKKSDTPTKPPEEKTQGLTEATAPPGFPPEEEILAKRVYPDKLVVVTRDGRKLVFPAAWQED